MKVGIVGCGLIGRKRAAVLGPDDELVACYDPVAPLEPAVGSAEAVIEAADAVIVATPHDALAELAIAALSSGKHVLVEKPAGISAAQVRAIADAAGSAYVHVGFNHRFHPAIERAVREARSGEHGEILHVRARYGHGGRPGYEREWRADPARSGGGELIDQGMHLLDLSHWLLGALPLHAALLRTSYWDAPVEDNAVLILGERSAGPWTLFHVSWTEWKNLFSLEIFCRTAKLQVDGLARSYGAQRLTRYRMRPELGPPDVDVIDYPPDDASWAAEWQHFKRAIEAGEAPSLDSAVYAWSCVEAAYESCR